MSRPAVALAAERVSVVLSDAKSIRSAVYQLGTSETTLRAFCRQHGLEKLRIACAARGTAKAKRLRSQWCISVDERPRDLAGFPGNDKDSRR